MYMTHGVANTLYFLNCLIDLWPLIDLRIMFMFISCEIIGVFDQI